MRPPLHVRTRTLALLLLLGAALFLSGAAGYWRWVMLGGYLLAVGAWWALVRPPLTTRQLRWRARRRAGTASAAAGRATAGPRPSTK